MIATEQYPKVFGPTVPDIPLSSPAFSKKKFSMLTPEVVDAMTATGCKDIVICGIESHVCLWQTVKELSADRNLAQNIYVVCDAASSQR